MSSIVVSGDTSGAITIAAPAVAGTNTLTLPASTGTVVLDSATQTLTNKTIQGGAITTATAQTTTSGTTVDFTGIPSWVKRITVMLMGVSTNSTSPLLLRLGTSGGFVTSGYSSTATTNTTKASSTAGLALESLCNTSFVRQGSFTLSYAGSNKWVMSGGFGDATDNNWSFSAGGISLSDTLTQIRITPTNGTDTFDAGSINILYE